MVLLFLFFNENIRCDPSFELFCWNSSDEEGSQHIFIDEHGKLLHLIWNAAVNQEVYTYITVVSQYWLFFVYLQVTQMTW